MINKRTNGHANGALLPVSDHPQYQRLRAETEALERRLTQAEEARQRELARLRGERTKRTVTERAKDLVSGGIIDPTPAANAAEARAAEIDLLRAALCEQHGLLDRFVADLSYDVALTLKPRYDEAMRQALTAMTALAAAVRDVEAIGGELRKLGYRPSSVVLPSLLPLPAIQLGDPLNVGMRSEAWRFRRELEIRGILR